jgi:hypothetical protein
MPTEKPTPPESPVAAAIAEIAGELGTVVKERVDAGRGGSYQAFTVDKIYEAVRPMLAARGVAVFPRPPHVEYTEHVSSSGGVQTTARYNGSWMLVHAASGDEILIGFEASARDNGDKAPIQAGQQAFKYAIVQMLQLGAGDPEAENPPEEALDPKVVAAQAADDQRRLENAARGHVFVYMAGEKVTADEQKAEAEAAWPLVLEASGVKEIATEADRDAVIAAADKLYGDEAGKQETMTEDK